MDDPSRFCKLNFWEDYHCESSQSRLHHEWFLESDEAKEWLLPYVAAVCRQEEADASDGLPTFSPPSVLHLGCGTSELGLQLAEEEIAASSKLRVINLDFSPRAIDTMQEAYGGIERNDWILGDALNMPFSPASFDLVVDKGTFDAFEIADVDCSRGAESLSSALCREVDRVLKRRASAAWVQITHTEPDLRLEMLSKSLPLPSSVKHVRDAWLIGHQSLGEDENGFEYYLYAVKRHPRFAMQREVIPKGLSMCGNVVAGSKL